MSTPNVAVYALDDCDWWVGESLEACIAAGRQECGADTYQDAEEDGALVGPEEMQRLIFTDTDAVPPTKRTFAEQLELEIAQGGSFPRLFASTEC